ncbi:MAG: MFS transporter [Deltaproteobacteria bacterium]|nr:MAG: MFS transporter [Deltaproteobacteria bacterium]
MAKRQLSPNLLLILLSVAVFLIFTVIVMLGPLLVDLAKEFRTSVAVTGQLAAATALTWALTALLAGPVSDIYGRRLIILVGLILVIIGTLNSALAWNYSSLLAFRLLTGVGAAVIPPNGIATVVDIFPPERRGKALGWLISAVGLGAAFGIPTVALLTDVGGWRLPFYVLGTVLLILWGILWVWFPRSQTQPGYALTFISHFREVGSKAAFWYLLTANCLMNMVFMGVSSYLPAYLMQIYRMNAGEIALPLMLAGLGVIAGSLIGGRVAGHGHRLTLISISFLVGALVASLVFTTHISAWITVGLSFGTVGLMFVSAPVVVLLLTEFAGQSRATATGMFVVSNQLGVVGGASIGGLMLSLGGFPMVGMFCSAAAATAAVVVRYKVRESAEFIMSTSCGPSKSPEIQ